MKVANIYLFKQFLTEKGAEKMFSGMYRQYAFPDNPTSVEDYLKEVDSDNVISNAFKFPENLIQYGPDYWFGLEKAWEKRLKDATENSNVYGAYAANKVAKMASKPLEMWNGPSFERKKKPAPEEATTTPRNGVTEEQQVLSGFKFFDIKKSTNRRLKDNLISINTRTSNSVTFNKTISDEIYKSKLKFMQVGQLGEENALFFVFSNDENGIPHRYNESNINICNKTLVNRINEFFEQSGDYNILHISKNMAKSKDYLTYKITK